MIGELRVVRPEIVLVLGDFRFYPGDLLFVYEEATRTYNDFEFDIQTHVHQLKVLTRYGVLAGYRNVIVTATEAL